ncbi:glutathione reductase [Diutina catenulata]
MRLNRLQAISRHLSTKSIAMAPVNTAAKHYDYLVIGGGSGGVASARRAASYGAKVLLVESKFEKLGGTCVNVGCVPKKVMWYAADLAHKVSHLYGYGLAKEPQHIGFGDFDWPKMKTQRDAYVKRLNGIYERNLGKEGVEYVYGFAQFLNENGDVEVTLSGDQKIEFLENSDGKKGDKLVFSADKVLVATGGQPSVPDVPGKELGISSDGFFELEQQPKEVLVVGAGYIAVELAGVFKALGSTVHLAIRHDKVLRSFDSSISDGITDYYSGKFGINLIKQSKSVAKIEEANGRKRVTLGNGDVLEVDSVLWTIGRKSLLGIGLDKVGVKVNDRNQIIADEWQQTSNPKIYSLGDVVGKVELTPVAIAAGRKLSNRLFSGVEAMSQDKLDYDNVPSAIFSHPEAGSIGLSEQAAIDKFGADNIKVYRSRFTSMYYAMVDESLKAPTDYKLVVHGPDEKVVGLHLLGDASAEILQGFGVAVKMGATKADFDNCVAIHPTSAEEIVTMR